jgi:hypothetical protein
MATILPEIMFTEQKKNLELEDAGSVEGCFTWITTGGIKQNERRKNE